MRGVAHCRKIKLIILADNLKVYRLFGLYSMFLLSWGGGGGGAWGVFGTSPLLEFPHRFRETGG
jgi:hypothetical protein